MYGYGLPSPTTHPPSLLISQHENSNTAPLYSTSSIIFSYNLLLDRGNSDLISFPTSDIRSSASPSFPRPSLIPCASLLLSCLLHYKLFLYSAFLCCTRQLSTTRMAFLTHTWLFSLNSYRPPLLKRPHSPIPDFSIRHSTLLHHSNGGRSTLLRSLSWNIALLAFSPQLFLRNFTRTSLISTKNLYPPSLRPLISPPLLDIHLFHPHFSLKTFLF